MTNATQKTAAGSTLTTPPLRRARAVIFALWATQILLAVTFLFAGSSKLVGVPAMVNLFAAIGWGQWFRYLTGAIEISAAVALLIPSAALFGAILLIPTMIGATIANLFFGQSPAPPLVLLLLATAVTWSRRNQLQATVARMKRGGR